MKKLFLAIAFLVLVLGAAGFWYWQKNSFSKDILTFEILAPKETGMGQEITYTVHWKNNGQILLENPVLTFEFPQGSVPSAGGDLRITQNVGDIYPGQGKTVDFKARLFGAQGDIEQAKAYLAYNPKNLQARYESNTAAITTLALVPVNFDFDLPSRMESGQAFTFTVNYFSNSDYPLAGTRIKIDYPAGFTFKSATPAPIGQNEWALGVLNKGKGGRITIGGTLQGQLQEVENFHGTLGTWNNGEFTLFKDVTRGVEIAQPKIEITQLINGNNPGGVNPGDLLHYEISFKNISDKDLENLFLAVNFTGNSVDFSSVNVQGATVNQNDDSITWQASNNAQLRFLGQGEAGAVDFWVKVKNAVDTSGPQTKNFVITDKVVLSDVTKQFDEKINSGILISQAAYYQDEVFGNEGSLPPRVGYKTTYTIIWKAQNLYNDVKNAKVKATLPQGVELTGKIFPENSSLTFDSQSREIVWTIGDMASGTGNFTAPSSVAFQVALTPSALLRGSVAQLVSQCAMTADDTWTEQSVFAANSALNTSLLSDTVSQNKGIVQ